MRTLLTLVAAAVVAAVSPAGAGDVRPPSGADISHRGATGGDVKLPGLMNIETPPMNTTMKEKRKLRQERKAVEKDTVKALRKLAIEEFDQSSSSAE